MLIQNSNARNPAKKQPQTRRTALSYAESDGHAAHPEERLKGIHGKETVHGQVNGAEKDSCGGEQVRKAAPTEFADHPRGEQHLGCRRQRREKANRVKRIAQQPPRKPADNRDQRSMIHISPGEMLSAGGIVQLVAKVAVAISSQQMDKEGPRGEGANDCRDRKSVV